MRYLRVTWIAPDEELYVGPVYTLARMKWVKGQLEELLLKLQEEWGAQGMALRTEEVLQNEIPPSAILLEPHKVGDAAKFFRRQYHEYYAEPQNV